MVPCYSGGSNMRTILKYPGAKNRIAEWICSYIPEHKVYLEPYAGSLAVFFNKPRSHIETVNDINGEVVNFFRVLRDKPEELKHLIELTPYSREEYNQSYQIADNDIERARRFCVRCWMGFGCSNLYRNGFKTGQQSQSPNPARAWNTLTETMMLATERLKGVQIEQLPALELINRYDTPDVFIYADPTYLHGTRKNYLYKYEMPDEEHIELLEHLTKHKGKVMISGYDNDLYNHYLRNWEKAYKETVAEAGNKRTEVIWMNYHQNKQMTITELNDALFLACRSTTT